MGSLLDEIGSSRMDHSLQTSRGTHNSYASLFRYGFRFSPEVPNFLLAVIHAFPIIA